MMLVRVLAAFAKPALVGGTLTVTIAGTYIGYDRWSDGGATPFQQLQSEGQRLLITEFGEDADTIVGIDPQNPDDRTEIAIIEHAPGWGVFAALSPDGEAIAYTALPRDTAQPAADAPAHAAIVDVDGDVTLLADDIDLLVPPVWAPDSSSIVVRKNVPQNDDAGSFELIRLGRDGSRETITSWSSAAVFPIDFSPDGSTLYFATLNQDGTDLYRVAPDGADETHIAHLSDEIARDWRISPDGTTLAYSVAESGVTPRAVAMKLDLATGAAERATAEDDRAEYHPTWNADGELTLSSVKPDGGGDALSVDQSGATSALTENADAIDLPLAWAPDGSALAVRTIEGTSADGAGSSYVELVRPDGRRERVSDEADVLIVGWLE